jgi:hypothetical protein
MGISIFPAPSAASKTRFVTTLTSGTSWTVPAGCLYVNATLVGGGGSGGSTSTTIFGLRGGGGQIVVSNVATTPGASIAYAIGAGGASVAAGGVNGNAGGTTTFTGATSAAGGALGARNSGNGAPGTEGISANNYSDSLSGAGAVPGAGGAGKIELEYWV